MLQFYYTTTIQKIKKQELKEKIYFSINDIADPNLAFSKLFGHEKAHMNTYDEGKDGEETAIHTREKVGSENKNKVFTEEEKADYLNNLRNKYKDQKSIEQQSQYVYYDFLDKNNRVFKDKKEFEKFQNELKEKIKNEKDPKKREELNKIGTRYFWDYIFRGYPKVKGKMDINTYKNYIKLYGVKNNE